MIKEFVCTVCPRSCRLKVDLENKTVSGNSCARGERYGLSEAFHPERTLTSTVKITGAATERCPVKTSAPIPKEKMFDIMKALNNVSVKAPKKIGDVIVENVCDTGADITVTKNIAKAEAEKK